MCKVYTRCHFAFVSSQPTVSFPIRIPADLKSQISTLAADLGISEQDVMRLCLRIGLTDIQSVNKEHAALVREAAEDMGKAFSDWAAHESGSSKPKAPTVIKGPTPASPAALRKPITYKPLEDDSLRVAER